MEFPSSILTCTTGFDENPSIVTVHVQSDNNRIDETALAQAIWRHLETNPDFVSISAERREQTFPVTPIPAPEG